MATYETTIKIRIDSGTKKSVGKKVNRILNTTKSKWFADANGEIVSVTAVPVNEIIIVKEDEYEGEEKIQS